VAAGRARGSLLLRGGRVINVFSNEILTADVLIAGRLVAAVGPDLGADADEVIDLAGAHLAPGLIDGHVHLESSLVTPEKYADAVLPRGVTSVVCDPHEIANVAGEQGVRWLLDATEELALDVYVTVPSCVPSTPFETTGADFELDAMERLLRHPRVVGVAEIMSFAAVVAGAPDVLAKAALAASNSLPADGHAPGLRGRALQAYVASGIASDHESTTLDEGLEKLRAGLFLMIREGSVSRDLANHLPLLDPRHGERIGFVTDDRLPPDLLTEGGVDHLVRSAIKAGADPAYAVRCASHNNANHYRLARRGAVAAGFFADLVVLGDLTAFTAAAVYKDGRLVARGGELVSRPRPEASPNLHGPESDGVVDRTVRLGGLKGSAFAIAAPADGESLLCIGASGNQLVTRRLTVNPKVENGRVIADLDNDVLKLACVERHGRGGGVGLGLVNGFGLRAGALASSVGHDHHNLMVVGATDADMLLACRRLEALGGGFVIVEDGAVLGELALPLAGLLTDAPLEDVAAALERLDAIAASLGNRLPSPFMALSFLGLAVIPKLKLTDRGLVDVERGALVDLVAGNRGLADGGAQSPND